MTGFGIFPRQVTSLVLHPRSAWQGAPALTLRTALTWQVVGGVACLALVMLRLAGLAATHPAYRGAGGGLLVGAAVVAELLGYFLYLPLAAWGATIVLRAAHPELRFASVFALLSYSTVPLLVGWIARAAVVWMRPAPGVAAAGGFHDYVAALWTALELRSDPSVLLAASGSVLSVSAGALGLFWIWHAVVLWSGLENRLAVERPWALAVLATLLGIVLAAHLAEASVGARWHELVVWTD